ncbi:MAG: hypothetical protein RL701_3139 [Pseudomonadota bacterium]|jgi:hypothetical protein
MRRIKPQATPQDVLPANASRWQEIALLVGYLVICLLSFLTVLMPTTENRAEQIETKAPSTSSEPPSR